MVSTSAFLGSVQVNVCAFLKNICVAVRVSIFLKVCLNIKNKYSHAAVLGRYCCSLKSSFHSLELHFRLLLQLCNMPVTSDEETDNLFNTFNFINYILSPRNERISNIWDSRIFILKLHVLLKKVASSTYQ